MPLRKLKGKQIDRRIAREAAMKNTVHCACTARALCVHRAALRVHCAALRVHCATSTAPCTGFFRKLIIAQEIT